MTEAAVRTERMGAPLIPALVYGPVKSRRLGQSLGINILPLRYKLCSFNCIYCEYGRTGAIDRGVGREFLALPTVEAVIRAAGERLRELGARGTRVDTITFSGNGEPTLHPRLDVIVSRIRVLRDRYLPGVPLAILSNGQFAGRPEVRRTLEGFDLKILKLDAGEAWMVQRINRPVRPFDFDVLVRGLAGVPGVVIQTMFIRGRIDNTDEESVAAWINTLEVIQPAAVHVYTLDRPASWARVAPVPLEALEAIADRVRQRTGLLVRVYGGTA